MRRKTQEQFIEEAKIIHKNSDLNYNQVKYINCDTKIIIGNKYGYCKIRPDSLLSGVSPTIRNSINKTEYWINMVKEVHGDLNLDYSKVKYVNNYTKVIVGTKHGYCKVIPSNLLNGSKFHILSAINKTEYWVSMAKEVHGEKYDYTKVKYKNNIDKVIIICPIHGEFVQEPLNHIESGGCLKCSRESHEGAYNIKTAERNKEIWLEKPAKVYTIQCWNDDENFYKIGLTTTSIERRFRGNAMPYRYRIIDVIYTNLYDAVYLENKMHEENKHSYEPKLHFHGYTECFSSLV